MLPVFRRFDHRHTMGRENEHHQGSSAAMTTEDASDVPAIRENELLQLTPLRGMEWHEEIASTNDRAIELAGSGEVAMPHLIIAERQSAGRGRGRNRWWSQSGGLLFSALVETGSPDGAPPRSRLALSAGLAVCESIERLLPGCDVRVKWPNDVYVNDRKICGILVEMAGASAVVGIGLNVNNSFETAPPDLQKTAISMRDATGRQFDRTELLVAIVNRLIEASGTLRDDEDDDLLARWSPRCYLTGRIVRIEVGDRSTVGRCRGIDEEGALVLDTESGPTRHLSGVISAID